MFFSIAMGLIIFLILGGAIQLLSHMVYMNFGDSTISEILFLKSEWLSAKVKNNLNASCNFET